MPVKKINTDNFKLKSCKLISSLHDLTVNASTYIYNQTSNDNSLDKYSVQGKLGREQVPSLASAIYAGTAERRVNLAR